MTHLSALAPPALEQAGEHDAVPLVGAVKCLPHLVSDDEPGTLNVAHLGVHVYMLLTWVYWQSITRLTF